MKVTSTAQRVVGVPERLVVRVEAGAITRRRSDLLAAATEQAAPA
jgi:hypothetical protein